MDKEEIERANGLKRLDLALASRNFEIDLFWKRSVFFWGFIAAAFVGFATTRATEAPEISVVLASFGLVCSAAWTLVNRGSKYWQEAWEQKLGREEKAYLGSELFKTEEPVLKKSVWLNARRFSVTKLAIALSDYTLFLWVCLLTWEGMRAFELTVSDDTRRRMVGGFIAITVAWVLLTVRAGRKSPADKG